MMLGMTDINAVIDSPFPYAELLYQITGSKLVTTAIMCWVSMILYCRSESQVLMIHESLTAFIAALIGQWITCGRLAWAFARDVSTFIGFIICTSILFPSFLIRDYLSFFACLLSLSFGFLLTRFQHGLPWSNHFSHISERYEFPLRTTILSLSFCALYGLLYIISTTAFNSIITSSILYLVSLSPQELFPSPKRTNLYEH